MEWTFPSLDSDMSIVTIRDTSHKSIQNVQPNGKPYNEPSHQDLHSLHNRLSWSTGFKGLTCFERQT